MRLSSLLAGVVSFCLILIACQDGSRDFVTNGPNSLQKNGIYGGADVPKEHFLAKSKMIVGILVRTGDSMVNVCTGSLVTDRHVVTAAHCLVNVNTGETYQAQGVQVVFSHDLRPQAPVNSANSRGVQFLDIHPRFLEGRPSDSAFAADIAVLTLKKSAPSDAQVFAINNEDLTLSDLNKGYIAGFGTKELIETTENGQKTQKQLGDNILRSAVLIRLQDHSPSQMIFDQANGSGACVGDSGGPFFTVPYEGETSWVLHGVISQSLKKGQDRNKCIGILRIVKTSAHYEWLQSILQK